MATYTVTITDFSGWDGDGGVFHFASGDSAPQPRSTYSPYRKGVDWGFASGLLIEKIEVAWNVQRASSGPTPPGSGATFTGQFHTQLETQTVIDAGMTLANSFSYPDWTVTPNPDPYDPLLGATWDPLYFAPYAGFTTDGVQKFRLGLSGTLAGIGGPFDGTLTLVSAVITITTSYANIQVTPTAVTMLVGANRTFTTDRAADWMLVDNLSPDPTGTPDGTNGAFATDDGSFSNTLGAVNLDAGNQVAHYTAPMTPGTYYLFLWDHVDA